ncbi:hypothetical protein OD91_2126 [Lutibacter sp. Hel_I_33_5]|uniref:outer membrane protein assembly factor n=1 Tax=Lutibacter sp. Hel_I_33_5 TaxID=1566289 RepID=UPI0011A0C55C|nr:outer membrane protein assembly factor [Lutibacter sp. Hel_I_33_5]TVZ56826.1 hypothetical protein OD91_2126 [Lutibacter sp. Hel_I_33_5]
MRFKISFLLFILCNIHITKAQEYKIEHLKINGYKKTKLSFLKSIVVTKRGDRLDSLTLEKDIISLKRLAAISNAYFKVGYSENKKSNVEIIVEENFTIIPEVNLWTSVNNQFSYKLGLYDYNFLGRNIGLGGFYQNNGFDTYAINFRAPNLFSRKWGLAINHQNWKSEEPLYFNSGSANYLYNNISFEILGLHQINFNNKISFGINFFNEKYKYLSGVTSATIPLNLDLNKKLLKFVYTYDNLNYFYQYIDGFKSELYLQYVVTENDFQNQFFVFWNDFFYFRKMWSSGVLANRLRIGLAKNDKTPFAPFAIDNNLNIRGVGILVDRGTGSVVLNSEYRHTLLEKDWFVLQSNTFIDVGSWRTPGGDLNDLTNHKNIQLFSGVGLRFIHKKIFNATFRIDYGFSLKDKSRGIVFGIGQYF